MLIFPHLYALACGAVFLVRLDPNLVSDGSFRFWHVLWMVYTLAAGFGLRALWVRAIELNGDAAGEGIRWGILGLACLALYHPYLTPSLVGGGDARGYAMQLADFVTQMRAGEFPVLVGQSAYAFNGDIHPLRTAPGMLYAAGILNLLIGFALSPIALLNLLIVGAGCAGAAGIYTALTRLKPRNGWINGLLTLLFISSPSILAPVYSGDMIATWTALPFLPWLALALVRIADKPGDLRAPARVVPILAALWFFHAPIAFWCTIGTVPFGLRWLLFAPSDRRRWLVFCGLGSLFVVLAGFVFASVLTLEIPADPNLRDAVERGAIRESLMRSWAGFMQPVSPEANALLSDLQLSPGLWFALAIGMLGIFRRHPPPSVRLLVIGILALLTLMLPGSDLLWRLLPDLVLTTTEKWPAQRFFPILSVAAVFLAAKLLASLRERHTRLVRDIIVILAVGCGWSGFEAVKFVQRGYRINHGASASAQLMVPGNAVMSRYAYEYYGRLPRYFSNGAVDPQNRSRFLDWDTLEPFLTNSIAVHGRSASDSPPLRFESTDYGGRYQPPLRLAPSSRHLLHFDFKGQEPVGVIQIAGNLVIREYNLPGSGEERAFGAGSNRDPNLMLWHGGIQPDQVEVRFVRDPAVRDSAEAPDIRVLPLAGVRLPIELKSLVPLRLNLDVPRPAWLETPRLYLPGYRAKLEGESVHLARSPDGLVMVPVPAGLVELELDYPGPFGLRAAFWLGAAGWGALTLFTLIRRFNRWSPFAEDPEYPLLCLGRMLPVLAIFGLGTWLTASVQQSDEPSPVESGKSLLHALVFELPYGRPPGAVEPLAPVSIGTAKLEFAITYVDGKQARIGCTLPGNRTFISDPFPINYLLRQHLVVRQAPAPMQAWEVRLNHRLVLTLPVP